MVFMHCGIVSVLKKILAASTIYLQGLFSAS